MANGTVYISATLPTLPAGSRTVGPFTLTLPTPRDVSYQPAIAVGANGPYACPSSPPASYCLIIPPVTNIAVLTLKGATGGDVGLPISGQNPTLIGLDPTATTININSTGVIPSGFEILFF